MFGARKLLKKAQNAQEGGPKAVLDVLDGLIAKQAGDRDAASDLVRILGEGVLPPDETARLFGAVFDAHRDDGALIAYMGGYMEEARDIDDLNAPPPDAPVFARMIARLTEIQLKNRGTEREKLVAEALAQTARLVARQHDDLAERTYRRLLELVPESSDAHYSYGLYCKTRGHFTEGVAANRRAIELHPSGGSEAARWNLGICATGAGDGQTAIEVWRAMGNKLEIADSGLPEGGYPACKVRVAQRPLAERGADNDDPGLQENIWVQRLSPCHGIVRSVMYSPEIGTDYGDTILFDGAPITYHLYGDKQIAVFPHLVTLKRGKFRFYDFAATQGEGDAVNAANDRLDANVYVYSHTTSVYHLCSNCWRDESVQHERHETEEHKVIHGRIAVHPDIPPAEALARIDAAYEGLTGARLFSPDLCDAAGQPERATLERRRFEMLREE